MGEKSRLLSKIKQLLKLNRDRISELPDHIIHQILSHLPPDEATRTRILSKRWLQSFVLDFDQSNFGKDRNNFLEYVNCSMERFAKHNLSMKKFELSISLVDQNSVSLADKWLGLAVDSLVEELVLNFNDEKIGSYILPEIVYDAASLKSLNLISCRLVRPVFVAMVSLRKISLIYVELDDHTMQVLIASCPCIEDIIMKNIKGLKNLEISGLNYLKRVQVTEMPDTLQKIQIDASSLESFQFINGSTPRSMEIIASSLKEASVGGAGITDEILHDLTSKCPRIESLILNNCSKLENINISMPLLSRLNVLGCCELVEAHIDAPNLLCFKYKGPILSSFTHNSHVCSANMHLYNAVSFFEWRNFISNSAQFNRLRLQIHLAEENVFAEKRLGESSLPALWEVNNLDLDVKSSPSIFTAFVESMIWSSKPSRLIVTNGPHLTQRYRMYMHQRLDRAYADCCRGYHNNCWRHWIKGLKVRVGRTQDNYRLSIIISWRYCKHGEVTRSENLKKLFSCLRTISPRRNY